jgi:hypothetical protein
MDAGPRKLADSVSALLDLTQHASRVAEADALADKSALEVGPMGAKEVMDAQPESNTPSDEQDEVVLGEVAEDEDADAEGLDVGIDAGEAASAEKGADGESGDPEQLSTIPMLVGKKRKRHTSAPKNPRSAYLFYVAEQRPLMAQDKNNAKYSFTEVARIIGRRWRSLSKAERRPYDLRAKEDLERYKREKVGVCGRCRRVVCARCEEAGVVRAGRRGCLSADRAAPSSQLDFQTQQVAQRRSQEHALAVAASAMANMGASAASQASLSLLSAPALAPVAPQALSQHAQLQQLLSMFQVPLPPQQPQQPPIQVAPPAAALAVNPLASALLRSAAEARAPQLAASSFHAVKSAAPLLPPPPPPPASQPSQLSANVLMQIHQELVRQQHEQQRQQLLLQQQMGQLQQLQLQHFLQSMQAQPAAALPTASPQQQPRAAPKAE